MSSILKKISNKQVVLALLVCTTYLLLFLFPQYWHYVLGPEHIPEVYPFLDMKGRLAHMEGHALGLDVYNMPNPLDPLERINDKPSYTLALGYLGFNLSHAVPLGILFITTMVLSSLCMIRPRTWGQALTAYLIICSPPILFVAERANDDIIIFAFFLAIPYLLSAANTLRTSLAFSLISLTGPAKYYPFVAYFLLIYRQPNQKNKIFWLCLSAITLGVVISLTYREVFFLLPTLQDSPKGLTTFGAKLLAVRWGYNQLYLRVITFLLMAVLLRFSIKISRQIKQLPKIEKYQQNFFILGTTILIFCFAINSNNDYRFVFCLYLLPALFSWLYKSTEMPKLNAILTTTLRLILIIFWMPYLYFLTKQYFGDQPEIVLYTIEDCLFGLRNLLTWGLMVLLTVLFFLSCQSVLPQNFNQLPKNIRLSRSNLKSLMRGRD